MIQLDNFIWKTNQYFLSYDQRVTGFLGYDLTYKATTKLTKNNTKIVD